MLKNGSYGTSKLPEIMCLTLGQSGSIPCPCHKQNFVGILMPLNFGRLYVICLNCRTTQHKEITRMDGLMLLLSFSPFGMSLPSLHTNLMSKVFLTQFIWVNMKTD